ncbi:hypothetical protein DFH29DRAFT_879991 [Suillus ampliporus]|nr:hypothetical protein DFH29DRAFT_879991 [Suillus ampliporus]
MFKHSASTELEHNTKMLGLKMEQEFHVYLSNCHQMYRDTIAYVFDSKQTNNFVTVLIPSRKFPYEMLKGAIALFDPLRLSIRISTSDIICKVVRLKFKDHTFDGSVKLQFDLDSWSKQIEARVNDVEHMFTIGDKVHIVAETYLGLKGHVMQKDDNIFHICQSGTQEQVEVSMYYLDCCPIDQTLQGHMSTQPYVNPPQEPKTIEIDDYIQVLIGDWIEKSSMVQWISDGFIWFQNEADLLRNNDYSGVAPLFIQVAATTIEHMCLPATLKFTKEYGYDIRPGDVADFTSFCKMCKQSYMPAPLQSVTPPLKKIVSSTLDPSSSFTWVTWFPEVLATMSLQTKNAGSLTEDPWTVNASDTMDAIIKTTQPKPCDPICWLKKYALQFHGYHALFNILVGFQGGKLLK